MGFSDDAIELGVEGEGSFWRGALTVWAAERRGVPLLVVDGEDAGAGPDALRRVAGPPQTAAGVEARWGLRTGLDGLGADGTLSLVAIDDGPLLGRRAPASAVVNPRLTARVSYAPSALPAALFVRTRALLPQGRLSPLEETDRLVCPERPTDAQLADGLAQVDPCTGVPGAFLLDVGGRFSLGGIEVLAVAENVLDQQAQLAREQVGSGGASFRMLLHLAL
jgi:hypothetical protein